MDFSLKRSNIIDIEDAAEFPARGVAAAVIEPAMDAPKNEELLDETAPPAADIVPLHATIFVAGPMTALGCDSRSGKARENVRANFNANPAAAAATLAAARLSPNPELLASTLGRTADALSVWSVGAKKLLAARGGARAFPRAPELTTNAGATHPQSNATTHNGATAPRLLGPGTTPLSLDTAESAVSAK
jgi:hypothetical protein